MSVTGRHRKRIGLFSGTFDPAHRGHVELAKAARSQAGLDNVWLWVNAQPGHKVGVAAYADRLAMAQLAIVGEPGLEIYDGPLAREPQVAATFKKLVVDQSGTDVVMVLGIDTLARLDRWADIESVVKMSTYWTARRDKKGEGEVAKLRRRLGALGSELQVELFSFETAASASSARIRAAVRAGEQLELVDPKVSDYILRRALYR